MLNAWNKLLAMKYERLLFGWWKRHYIKTHVKEITDLEELTSRTLGERTT